MTISVPPCGPHCGATAVREAHCDCEICHAGQAPVVITRSALLTVVPKASMCDRWYARAGDYRPWHGYAGGCMCGVAAHALPGGHGKHCPVRRHHDRELLEELTSPQRSMLAKLTGQEPGPEPVPDSLACPLCPATAPLDPDNADNVLGAFWDHLGTHTQNGLKRLELWTAAMGAGKGP